MYTKRNEQWFCNAKVEGTLIFPFSLYPFSKLHFLHQNFRKVHNHNIGCFLSVIYGNTLQSKNYFSNEYTITRVCVTWGSVPNNICFSGLNSHCLRGHIWLSGLLVVWRTTKCRVPLQNCTVWKNQNYTLILKNREINSYTSTTLRCICKKDSQK